MSATLDALESGAPKGVTGTNHDARLKSNLYGSGNVKSFTGLQLSRGENKFGGGEASICRIFTSKIFIAYAKRIRFI